VASILFVKETYNVAKHVPIFHVCFGWPKTNCHGGILNVGMGSAAGKISPAKI
jgi:hypothetical protein